MSANSKRKQPTQVLQRYPQGPDRRLPRTNPRHDVRCGPRKGLERQEAKGIGSNRGNTRSGGTPTPTIARLGPGLPASGLTRLSRLAWPLPSCGSFHHLIGSLRLSQWPRLSKLATKAAIRMPCFRADSIGRYYYIPQSTARQALVCCAQTAAFVISSQTRFQPSSITVLVSRIYAQTGT